MRTLVTQWLRAVRASCIELKVLCSTRTAVSLAKLAVRLPNIPCSYWRYGAVESAGSVSREGSVATILPRSDEASLIPIWMSFPRAVRTRINRKTE